MGLLTFAKNGKLDEVQSCIEDGADPNEQDGNGCTALYYASQAGHYDVVDYLSKLNKIDLNLTDILGHTALMRACINANTKVALLLINKTKALCSLLDEDGCSAAHFAAYAGDLEVLKALLQSGIDVKSTTPEGRNLLHFAADAFLDDRVKWDVIDWLFENGLACYAKDINGQTPRDILNSKDYSYAELYDTHYSQIVGE